MLWLSGLMGLMAVGAFTLLWFLPVRRKDEGDMSEETSNSYANALAGPAPEDATTLPTLVGKAEDLSATAEAAMFPSDETFGDTITVMLPAGEADDEVKMDVLHASAENDDAEDWFATDADASEFDDFDPQEDDLVVVWDDARGTVPEVSVVRADEDPAIARVILGDTIIAQFRTRSDMTYDAVSLVPLSTARSLGWAHP